MQEKLFIELKTRLNKIEREQIKLNFMYYNNKKDSKEYLDLIITIESDIKELKQFKKVNHL